MLINWRILLSKTIHIPIFPTFFHKILITPTFLAMIIVPNDSFEDIHSRFHGNNCAFRLMSTYCYTYFFICPLI